MSGSRNRTAGNNYEREIVQRYNSFGFTNKEGELIPLFPPVGTTRNLSTAMDAMKIDITPVDPRDIPKFGLLIQAKNTTNTAQYPKLLTQLDEAVERYGGIPLIYHKQTQRTGSADNPRFMARGEYVSMKATDFEAMITKLRLLEDVHAEVMGYFDSFSKEIQKDLNEYLSERNM